MQWENCLTEKNVLKSCDILLILVHVTIGNNFSLTFSWLILAFYYVIKITFPLYHYKLRFLISLS